IWRTGAFGETTNFVSLGSSKRSSSTPFWISTSNPSASASGRRDFRAASRASSLRSRNACSDSVDVKLLACGWLTGACGQIAGPPPSRHPRLFHAQRQLVHLAVKLLRLETEDVLAVQLLCDA